MENLVKINLGTELDPPTKSTYIDYFDTVNNLIVSYPIAQEDNCHFKIVVSDNPTSDFEKYLKTFTKKVNTNTKNKNNKKKQKNKITTSIKENTTQEKKREKELLFLEQNSENFYTCRIHNDSIERCQMYNCTGITSENFNYFSCFNSNDIPDYFS